MALAVKLANAFDADLTIAHATPEPVPTVDPLAGFQRSYEAYAERLVQEVRAMISSLRRTETVVLHGPPAEALASAAETGDVDLVVVGSRGRGVLARTLLGSVSDRLAHVCHRPVLVVR